MPAGGCLRNPQASRAGCLQTAGIPQASPAGIPQASQAGIPQASQSPGQPGVEASPLCSPRWPARGAAWAGKSHACWCMPVQPAGMPAGMPEACLQAAGIRLRPESQRRATARELREPKRKWRRKSTSAGLAIFLFLCACGTLSLCCPLPRCLLFSGARRRKVPVGRQKDAARKKYAFTNQESMFPFPSDSIGKTKSDFKI